jgi:prepilin-type N-terminal cleavage/methylation domain-containing protein
MRPGFTLIETLIALIIAAMVTFVLLDTLSAISAQASRLDRSVARTQEQIIGWLTLERAVAGLLPDYLDGPAPFEGDETRFRGLSDRPMTGHPGAPGIITLSIEQDADDPGTLARLVYAEGGEVLLEVELGVDARLAYIDFEGVEHAAWPPPEGFINEPVFYRPTPHLIAVHAAEGAEQLLHAFPVTRTRPPYARISDTEF